MGALPPGTGVTAGVAAPAGGVVTFQTLLWSLPSPSATTQGLLIFGPSDVETGAGATKGPFSQYQFTSAFPCVVPPLSFKTCSIFPLPVRDTESGDSKEFSTQAGTDMPRCTVTA